MKDRDLWILVALIALVYLVSKQRQAAAIASAPVGTVTTTETVQLPDGTILNMEPGPVPPTDNLAYWYSILQLGQL